MSIELYRHTQQIAEAPRAEEYRRLGQLTAALVQAQKNNDSRALGRAVAENQKFWSALRLAMVSAVGSLPAGLRAQFVSLADWVERESVLATLGRADIESLIAVNRQIMEGLEPYRGSIQEDSLQLNTLEHSRESGNPI